MTEQERLEQLADFRESEMMMIALLSAPGNFVDKTLGAFNLEYKINRGERIERIASLFSVTVRDLIDRNNLIYPFIDSETSDKYNANVLVAGETILVPTAAERADQGFLKKAFPEDAIYGCDLKFDFDIGDIVVNESETDCEVINGVDSVLQHIKIMFRTPIRRLIDFVNYGNPLKIGRLGNLWQITMDKINIINAIMTDKRAKSANVSSVVGGGQGDLQYSWQATLIDSNKPIEDTI